MTEGEEEVVELPVEQLETVEEGHVEGEEEVVPVGEPVEHVLWEVETVAVAWDAEAVTVAERVPDPLCVAETVLLPLLVLERDTVGQVVAEEVWVYEPPPKAVALGDDEGEPDGQEISALIMLFPLSATYTTIPPPAAEVESTATPLGRRKLAKVPTPLDEPLVGLPASVETA